MSILGAGELLSPPPFCVSQAVRRQSGKCCFTFLYGFLSILGLPFSPLFCLTRMLIENAPGASRILCIAVDNNPMAGSYYVDPGLQDSAVLSSPDNIPLYSYQAPIRLPALASTNSFYDVGGLIAAATDADIVTGALNTGTFKAWGGGYFSTPVSINGGNPAAGNANGGSSGSFLGRCSAAGDAGANVGFYQDTPLRSCVRPILMTASTCQTLSAVYATAALLVSNSPASTLATAATTFTRVTLGNVFKLWSNGTLYKYTSASAAAAAVAATAYSTTPDSCVCSDAAIGITYRFLVSSSTNTITGVVADVVTSDIVQPIAECNAGVETSVPFSGSVHFIPDQASQQAISSSLSNDNVLPTTRSGAPGYLNGRPVLAGVMITSSGAPPASAASTDQKAVTRSVPAASSFLLASAASNSTGVGTGFMGLFLRGGSDGTSMVSTTSYTNGGGNGGLCVPYPSIPVGTSSGQPLYPSDPATQVPVTFGEDAVVGCSMRLTYNEFASLCQGSPSSLLQYLGISSVDPTTGNGNNGPGLLSTFGLRLTPTHVGTIGSADPLKSWQWLPLTAPATTPAAASWDATSGTCTGILSGIQLQFLTAPTGQVGNPQQRIVAARYTYVTDTWRWNRAPGGSQIASTTNTQGFSSSATVGFAGDATQVLTLRSTVTWVSMAAQVEGFTPPAPPVVPPLPSDLFYPFLTSSSSTEQGLTVSGAEATELSFVALAMAAIVVSVVALR
jgi:Protein of unknown function (DUF1619)